MEGQTVYRSQFPKNNRYVNIFKNFKRNILKSCDGVDKNQSGACSVFNLKVGRANLDDPEQYLEGRICDDKVNYVDRAFSNAYIHSESAFSVCKTSECNNN